MEFANFSLVIQGDEVDEKLDIKPS